MTWVHRHVTLLSVEYLSRPMIPLLYVQTYIMYVLRLEHIKL